MITPIRKRIKPTIAVTGPEVGEPMRKRPIPAEKAPINIPILLYGKD